MSYATLADAFADAAPRSIGALLWALDPYALKLSVQVLNPYEPGGAVWDQAHWDVDNWQAVGQWQDITARVQELAWQRGSDEPGGPPRVGDGTVTLENNDGDASPWADSGDFAQYGRSWLRIGAFIRWGVTTNQPGNPYYPFFTGRISTMPEQTEQNVIGWVNVGVVELTADLAAVDRTALDTAVGGGETPEQRMQRLLDDADCVAQLDVSVDTWIPGATMQATTMSGNRLTEAQLVAASVGGRLLATSAGKIMLTGQISGTVPETLADLGARTSVFSNHPSGTDYPMEVATPYSDYERILNDITAARAGGTELRVFDPASINQFGDVSSGFGFPRDDLICESDDTVGEVIGQVLAQHAWDETGIQSFSLDSDITPETPALLYAMALIASLSLERRAEVTVEWTHPSLRVLSQTCLIDAHSHTLKMEGDKVSWGVDVSTSTYQPGPN